jgi:excisionase family DNA binding protein
MRDEQLRSSALNAVMMVEEVAALLHVHKQTVYQCIAAGTIPGAKKVGRVFRFNRARVMEWLNSDETAQKGRRKMR